MWSNTLQGGFFREDASELYPNDLEMQKVFILEQMFGDIASMGIGGIEIDVGAGGMITSLEVELASGGQLHLLLFPP